MQLYLVVIRWFSGHFWILADTLLVVFRSCSLSSFFWSLWVSLWRPLRDCWLLLLILLLLLAIPCVALGYMRSHGKNPVFRPIPWTAGGTCWSDRPPRRVLFTNAYSPISAIYTKEAAADCLYMCRLQCSQTLLSSSNFHCAVLTGEHRPRRTA